MTTPMQNPANSEFSRREFIQWASALSLGGLSMLALAGCGNGGGDGTDKATNTSGGGFRGGGDELKVGLIGPFSGPGAFVGRIVDTSIDAAVQQINSTGGFGGRKVSVIKRDTGIDPAAGVKAYQEFAGDTDIIGVLWCLGAGLDESLGQIARDGMPVIAVFNDLFSDGKLFPESNQYRSIFQLQMPDKLALDVLARYCKEDRGYRKVGLIYDGLLFSDVNKRFEASMKRFGITAAGVETYQLNDSDFGSQLARLRGQKPEALFVWGVAGDTAGIVKQLDRLGAAYIDTPTAKGGAWHPHIMGSPGGTGEHTWADLAGGAAKAGTLTVWHIGGLVYLPSFQIRDWIKKHLNKGVTGGEESPADGLYTLLKGVEKAGTTDRQKVVAAIESMGKIKFSSVEFGFSADRHLAKTEDDLNVVTLERSTGPAATDPPYELGREWKDNFSAGYVGPTHLVRPTLEANKRAHPEVMAEVLSRGYGTQCTKLPDGSLAKTCKIH